MKMFRQVVALLVLGLALAVLDRDPAGAREQQPNKRTISVKLVTDFETGRLVSDLEKLDAVKQTITPAAAMRSHSASTAPCGCATPTLMAGSSSNATTRTSTSAGPAHSTSMRTS